MTPRICVSILPNTVQHALKMIDRCEKAGADLIEIRLDCLKNIDGLADLALHGKTPKIATIRPLANHGKFSGSGTQQKRILLAAAKSGFEYVDIDLYCSSLKDFMFDAHEFGAKVIVSFHDFEGTLKLVDLDSVLEQEIAYGADVCKIATTIKQIDDNLALLNFTMAARKRANVICFAIGETGRISRLLSPIFGGFLTFAALDCGAETGPGQMTVEEMRSIYKAMGLT